MTPAAALPLPDVIELADLTTEFGALLEWCDSELPSFAEPGRRRRPLQVRHLDDARPSTYALFA
jgi:hypothetical protein